MIGNVRLGQYVVGDSIMHKLDPRIKILLFVLEIITIFNITTIWAFVFITLLFVLQIFISKLSANTIWTTIMPVLPIAIFVFIINAFTQSGENVVFKLWILKVTDNGLKYAFLMTYRLILMILGTSILLTLTTTPLKFAESLESILKPFKIVKFPVHEICMMMSIALRFIPILIKETDKIMKAQVSRGADYDTGSVFNRVKGYIAVLIPLLISSFIRAEELAVAMEARCYHGGDGRTKLNPLKICVKDIVICIICIVTLVITKIVDVALV